MSKLLLLGLTVLGVYVAAGLFLLFSLDRIMYHPYKGLAARPEDFGLKADDVSFTSADGISLHGWYFSREGSGAVLLYLHGNAGNIGHRLPVARHLLRTPADLFLFDYRGYGRSGGEARGEGPLEDARAALDLLREDPRAAGKKIVLVGESIGGSIALVLAAEGKVDGVVTLAAFTSTRGVARGLALFAPFAPLVPDRYDALGALSALRVPVLFVHGRRDEVIPFAHGERLFEAAGSGRESLWVDGAMHDDLFEVAGIEIVDRIGKFVERL